MAWTTTDDVETFLREAGGFLEQRPDRNTVLLTVSASLRAPGEDRYGDRDPVFGWWSAPDGRVGGAFVWTPPHPVLVSSMPGGAAGSLEDVLARGPHPVTGVNGRESVTGAFAAAWSRRSGGAPRVVARHRLYRLDRLAPPDPPPPGRARTATVDDRDLLVQWCDGFSRDTGQRATGTARLVDARLARRAWTLWEDGNTAVSLAGLTPPVAGTARVACVYTPDALRGRGYAGAVTAEVTRAALDSGAREVVLFTDLANPTSNALYQRLGYRQVEDGAVYAFPATGR